MKRTRPDSILPEDERVLIEQIPTHAKWHGTNVRWVTLDEVRHMFPTREDAEGEAKNR